MENPGSSIISALGAGSGVNFVQLAGDIADATYAAQRINISNRNETLEARISAASNLRNILTELSSALGDRIRNGDVSRQGSVDDPGVASVSVPAGTTPTGTYSLEVSQLAQSQTLVSQSFAAPDDLVGEGSLTIRFGTVAGASFTEDVDQPQLDITVEATDTLETLAAKITAQSDDALDAYVVQGTNGAQLVVKGREGDVNGFTLEGVSAGGGPAGAPGDLTYLSWQPSTDAGELRQTAQDAVFELDTVEIRSASNTVTGLPEGMTLQLEATNIGTPTTISFDTDNSAISDVVTDLVAALNDVARVVSEDAAAQGGTLGSDPGARALRADLRNLTREIVMPNADPDEPSTLADLGIRVTADGTFELDAERLNQTLSENPEATAAMFTTGVFGVFATIDSFARENTTTTDPGSLGGSVERYEGLIERNEDRLERIAEQQETLRQRLVRDLVAAETRITSSQATLSFLQQQFDQSDNN
ncbi:MAG: flagellar filament capping protein FliD [Pseudomonadota bacterium]